MTALLMRMIDTSLFKHCDTCDGTTNSFTLRGFHRTMKRQHPLATYIINETDLFAKVRFQSKERPYTGYIEIDACKYCMDNNGLSYSIDETDNDFYWVNIKKYNKKPELY